MTIEEKIHKEPMYILCVDNPTEEQIDIALRQGGIELLHLFMTDERFDKYYNEDERMLIKNINGLSETKIKEVLFKDYTMISKLDNPSQAVQIFAISRNPVAITYITTPSVESWKLAVSKKGSLIDYLYDPPEEIQLAAVKNDVKSIKYIDNPTKKVQLYTIRLSSEMIPSIRNIDSDVACECIKRYGISAFIYLRKTDEKVLNLIKNQLKNM